jgi:hypothetical protein
MILLYTVGMAVSFFLFQTSSRSSTVPSHPRIVIRGGDGAPLSNQDQIPYSPRKTCGACHDYDRITRGYHFQQGRTDGSGKIVISDHFDPKYPWSLSSGMYGKCSPESFDFSHLAKKVNRGPSDIDKSAFFFVQHCGPCHPGGGFGERDRNGYLYYDDSLKKFGSEVMKTPVLDGDYTPFTMGDGNYGAPWDKSGLSEADCLICHLKGYQWRDRGAALRGRFFKFGPSVGVGWAAIKSSPGEVEPQIAEEVRIDYGKKEIADFENLHLQIVRRPPDENCWFCHVAPDGKKRGRQWSPDADIHNARGLNCVSCHPSDMEHNFAKGDVLGETVRDDLDNSMPSCEDCHYRGKDRRAPRHKHPFSPRHMKRIACQTCHIPYETAAADLVYDHASTGATLVYDTPRFLSSDPLDPKKAIGGVDSNIWYPAIREHKGKVIPVKSLVVIYWGDLDEKTKVVKPIPLWKIRGLKKPVLRDDDGDGNPEVNSQDEIRGYLKVFKEKDSLGNPVAVHPVLIKGGFLYHLDKRGEIEKVRHEQAAPSDFSLSHNVMSGQNVIGARGCKDCHTKNSPFFLRKVLVDPFDERGKPVYMEAWERLGVTKERLGRLLMEQ